MTNEQCQNRVHVVIKSMNTLTQKGSPTLIAYMYVQGGGGGGSGGHKIGYKVQKRAKTKTTMKKKTGFKIQNYYCCRMLPAQNDKKSRKS